MIGVSFAAMEQGDYGIVQVVYEGGQNVEVSAKGAVIGQDIEKETKDGYFKDNAELSGYLQNGVRNRARWPS
jgi:hypothetical protein